MWIGCVSLLLFIVISRQSPLPFLKILSSFEVKAFWLYHLGICQHPSHFLSSTEDFGLWLTVCVSGPRPAIIRGDLIHTGYPPNSLASQALDLCICTDLLPSTSITHFFSNTLDVFITRACFFSFIANSATPLADLYSFPFSLHV